MIVVYNKAFILLAQRESVRPVPRSDWLDNWGQRKSIANADVYLSCKMASLMAVMQTNRSNSVSLRRHRSEAMSYNRFTVLDKRVIVFLSLVSMLHSALADGKTLVLLDNLNIRDTHSIFFRSLAG